MIQALTKSFGQLTDKETEENSNNAFPYYLYTIIYTLRDNLRAGVQQSLISLGKGRKKREKE